MDLNLSTLSPLYFGCWGESGHYLFPPVRWQRGLDPRVLPWPRIDATLCPGRRNRLGEVPYEDQVEGLAALHCKDGWTALAFWDRSVDARHNSNSAFFARGEHDFDTMCSIARAAFPEVWARITASFRVFEAPR